MPQLRQAEDINPRKPPIYSALGKLGEKVIADEVEKIPSDKVRELTKERLKKLEEGAQDLYF